MRIVKSISSCDDIHEELRLNKDGELEYVEREEYSIYLSLEEHKNNEHSIGHIIEGAIKQGLEVYAAVGRADKFRICGDDLVTSNEVVLIFTAVIDDDISDDEDVIESDKSKALEERVIEIAKIVGEKESPDE